MHLTQTSMVVSSPGHTRITDQGSESAATAHLCLQTAPGQSPEGKGGPKHSGPLTWLFWSKACWCLSTVTRDIEFHLREVARVHKRPLLLDRFGDRFRIVLLVLLDRAAAGQSRLDAELRKDPLLEDDVDGEDADKDEELFHGVGPM